MPTPLLIDGFRMLLLFTAQNGGRPWSTKFDYVWASEDPIPDVLDATTDFRTAFIAAWVAGSGNLANQFANSTQLAGVRGYRLTDPMSGAELPGSATVIGGGAGVTAAEVAAVTSLRTAALGRRYRGRQYWGGLSTTAVQSTTGQLLAVFRTSLVTLVNSLNTVTVGTGLMQHAVISGQGLDIPRPPGLATPVTSVLCDQFPDTQRRRGAR